MKTVTRESVADKAVRIKGNHRAIKISDNLLVVIGDHSTYQVSHIAGQWACNCPWTRYRGTDKPCSHIQAAEQALRDPASQAAVAPLAQMLTHSAN